MRFNWFSTVFAPFVLAVSVYSAEPFFSLHVLDAESHTEGCTVFDVNGDGRLDITCGGFWYEQPEVAWNRRSNKKKFNPRYLEKFVRNPAEQKKYQWKRHEYRQIIPGRANTIDRFLQSDYGEFLMDVNKDGRVDVIGGGWLHDGIYWYENPGTVDAGLWKAHLIGDDAKKDSATEGMLLVDVDGDGRGDVIPQHYGPKGIWWYSFNDDLSATRHVVGSKGDIHGVGFGDLDGDGRGDILTIHGWYKAPADPRKGKWEWIQEEGYKNIGHTSIPILVYDVNSDGKNDIIFGRGHSCGVYWLEQVSIDGKRSWKQHAIDDRWSQAHCLELADLNGDGRVELITGKRLYGHGGGDPGGQEPQGVFYYTFDKAGKNFKRYVLAYNAGVGLGADFAVKDIDGDGDLDIVCPGQGGLYLLENRGPRNKR